MTGGVAIMPRRLPAGVLAVTDGDQAAVRNHILEAAHRVIAAVGLAGASTRAIAEEAGVAGGTLYNYFENHIELLSMAIVHHAASLTGPVVDLPDRAGRYTVDENLRYFVEQATTALEQIVPLVAAAFSDDELLDAVRRRMTEVEPIRDPAGVVEKYLRAERRLGRIRADVDGRAVASVIVSLCHDEAFQKYLRGGVGEPASWDKEIDFIVGSLTASKPGKTKKGTGRLGS